MTEDIIRYIDEEMTPMERQSFEDRLSADPELRKQLKYARAAKKVSEEFIVIETLENIQKIRSGSTPTNKSGNWWTRWVVLLIAFMLLGLISWWMMKDRATTNTQETTQILAEVYKEPIWPLERSGDDLISTAVRLHLAGNTSAGLDMLLSGEEVPDVQKYWAAEILVHDVRCEDALPLLAELEEKGVEMERVSHLMKVCTTN